jgi:6-pyruvoyl-tetrahydropterin synthase
MIAKSSIDSFRLSFNYRFEAAHRLTRSSSVACMTPHGHTWYAKATFEASGSELNTNDMIMEFSQLKGSWKRFIQETADHSFMHHHQDPILPTLKTHIPEFRGLAFPGDPTTELISALFFAKLSVMHEALKASASAAGSGSIAIPNLVSVAIRETPTNTVIFRAGNRALLNRINEQYEGWWQSADPSARDLKTGPPAC